MPEVLPGRRIAAHAGDVPAHLLHVLQRLGHDGDGLPQRLLVLVRQDGLLELPNVSHRLGRVTREQLDGVQRALLLHVLQHRPEILRDLRRLQQQRLQVLHQILRRRRRREHLLQTLLLVHLPRQLGTQPDQVVHAHARDALDLTAVAHDQALALASRIQRPPLRVGDGQLRGDVDDRLRDQPALVRLHQRVPRDDDAVVVHLDQHLHLLQARPDGQHVAHLDAADPNRGADLDAAREWKLHERLVRSQLVEVDAEDPLDHEAGHGDAAEDEEADAALPDVGSAETEIAKGLDGLRPDQREHRLDGGSAVVLVVVLATRAVVAAGHRAVRGGGSRGGPHRSAPLV